MPLTLPPEAIFTYHGTTRLGVVIGDEDLFDVATVLGLPQDMIGLLEAGAPALNRLGECIARGGGRLPL